MFQANHIAEPLHRKTGKEEVFEFSCGIQRGGIINDMVVERILSRIILPLSQFHASLVISSINNSLLKKTPHLSFS